MDKEEKKPEISIIVPVYNVEKYLNKCIDSILNQTFKDFELILVDDGSPDNSGKICDEYVLKDSRVKVIHKENGGLSSARNTGLDIAQGEYIGFVDSDDWIEPDMYEVLYKICKKENLDIGVIGFQEVNNGLVEKKINYFIEKFKQEEALKNLIYKNAKDIGWTAWNKLWKADIFEKVRFKNGRIYEDGLFLYNAILKIKIVGTTNQIGYNYRIDNLSITRSSLSVKQLDFLYNTLDIAKILPEPYKTDMFLRDLLRYTEYILLEIIKQNQYKKAKKILNGIKKFYKENSLEIQKIRIDNNFIRIKFYILKNYPELYLIMKKLTRRY